jgi:sec-independent protein translocase protein TatC
MRNPFRKLRARKRKAQPAGEMSLIGHLGELRRRLFISIIAVFLGAVVGFLMWDWILDVATAPYCKAQAERDLEQIAGASSCQLYITDPLQLLTTRISVATYVGIILAVPILVWQLWRFITPGLNRNEKRYAIPFVVSSVLLFALGAAAAWFTFPKAIAFFLAVGGDNVLTLFNPAPYLKLIFMMMLISGLVFELPIVLVFLELAGVVTSRQLRNWRRYAIVINFAVAAIATPSQDPYSLLAMALPMCILYEVAIIIGRVLKK